MFGIKEIDAPDLARLIETADHPIRVIDVRQHPEIAAGTIPGAEAVPLHTLPVRVGELSRTEKLIMVCRSGARSAQACMFLAQQGFDEVYNLRGGMIAWAQNGHPIGAAAGA